MVAELRLNGVQNQIPAGITSSPTTPSGLDPFDPESIRLSNALPIGSGVKKELTTIPIRKPAREWFFRCHPDQDAYHLPTKVVELKEGNEIYLVSRDLWEHPKLSKESAFVPRLIIPCINKQGALFLWPIRMPGPDGRNDSWSKSAMVAASRALTSWVRMQSNQEMGAYEVTEATGYRDDPEWPDKSLMDLLNIAFEGRRINSIEHTVLKRLRGEI